jgi:hypothetical protein
MAYKSRSKKTRSVHQSLESSRAPISNQGEVWDGIAMLQAKACAPSPTSAMSDVYKAREEDLRQCDQIFKPVTSQVGLLAFIGGKPAGADMVSLASAYAKLHPKLVRSYTLEDHCSLTVRSRLFLSSRLRERMYERTLSLDAPGNPRGDILLRGFEHRHAHQPRDHRPG